jgi:hypothetical protein
LIVTELDLGYGGGENFNNGSYLAAHKPLLRHITQHGDFGKKFHLSRLLISKNIARHKSRSIFIHQNNPTTPNPGSPAAAPQFKVDDVPGPVLIGSSEGGFLFQRRIDQHRTKFFRMSGSHSQQRVKDTRLMPSARMPGTQTIIPKLLNLDNRGPGIR